MNFMHHSTAPRTLALLAMTASATMLTGCEAIKGIFKAGFWVGAIIVFMLVALVGGAVAFMRR